MKKSNVVNSRARFQKLTDTNKRKSLDARLSELYDHHAQSIELMCQQLSGEEAEPGTLRTSLALLSEGYIQQRLALLERYQTERDTQD